jgi:hypothetical protein
MDPFNKRGAALGIHFEERFPLVGLRSVLSREVPARSAHYTPPRLYLTFGRLHRHFLAIWRGNPNGTPPVVVAILEKSYGTSFCDGVGINTRGESDDLWRLLGWVL